MLLNGLTHNYIISRFIYVERTGNLFWANGRCAGEHVGSLFRSEHGKEYWRTKLCGLGLLNHRIIWFMKTRETPEMIDHRNGDGLDNAWDNLRDATQAQNFANMDRLIRGIDQYPNGKWRAKITIDYSQIHLGMFDTQEQALAVYKKALTETHGEYAVYNRG